MPWCSCEPHSPTHSSRELSTLSEIRTRLPRLGSHATRQLNPPTLVQPVQGIQDKDARSSRCSRPRVWSSSSTSRMQMRFAESRRIHGFHLTKHTPSKRSCVGPSMTCEQFSTDQSQVRKCSTQPRSGMAGSCNRLPNFQQCVRVASRGALRTLARLGHPSTPERRAGHGVDIDTPQKRRTPQASVGKKLAALLTSHARTQTRNQTLRFWTRDLLSPNIMFSRTHR